MNRTRVRTRAPAVLLGLALGCTNEEPEPEPVDRGTCDVLIACAQTLAPESLPGFEDTYGPTGMCWTSPELAAACHDSCRTSLENLAMIAETTGEPACGTCTSAADCSEFGPLARCDLGLCETETTGEATINCAGLPDVARGLPYSHVLGVLHGSGQYDSWSAQGLPDGLVIAPLSGAISGTTNSPPATYEVVLTTRDIGENRTISSTCALGLKAEFGGGLATLDPPCLGVSTSAAELDELLGGDGSVIACRLAADGSASCPLGQGNGSLPPGIVFDEASCTHQGSIDSAKRGTWVWIVEMEQSGEIVHVPYCATNDVASYHEIALTVDGAAGDPLAPIIYEYDPDNELNLAMGSHRWDISSPNCPGSECNTYGFIFTPSCSPFSAMAPYEISLSPSGGTATGLFHELTATGPIPSAAFAQRPFVAAFEVSYCTSSSNTFCGTDDPATFEQNAQTGYHFAVLGRPRGH
ncbi:MAG: hypothetical protein HC927_01170 [Deltaproteobacteria bacterium]|nr:hypothetical protein [Deltaproteobacteria bacterium]